MEKVLFEVGNKVKCIKTEPLPGRTKCPDLEMGKEYRVQGITLDSKNNQHLDVGLKSELEWITSYETGEHLTGGSTYHWCHPSRFELIDRNQEEL